MSFAPTQVVEECLLEESGLKEGVREEEEQGEEEEEEEDWSRMDGEVVTVELQQNDYGLGLSLAGAKVGTSIALQHKDTNPLMLSRKQKLKRYIKNKIKNKAYKIKVIPSKGVRLILFVN